MDLKKYFVQTKGFGVLSTSKENGQIYAAAYAAPKVIDQKHIAFIMGDRLSYANLSKNPKAVYFFKEENKQADGIRLYLKKT